MSGRRIALIGVSVALGSVLTASPADAAGGPSYARSDIDCDGTTDTVIGVPSATVDGHAGAVDVHSGNGRNSDAHYDRDYTPKFVRAVRHSDLRPHQRPGRIQLAIRSSS